MAITKIATVTVGAGGASSIDFTSIPGTYTDLMVVASMRNSANNNPWIQLKINGSTASITTRILFTDSGGSASSFTNTADNFFIYPTSGSTSNTFGIGKAYFPNYSGSTNKSISIESNMETNATGSYNMMSAGLWSNTAAITSLSLVALQDSHAQYSTATLYGVLKGSSGGVTVS